MSTGKIIPPHKTTGKEQQTIYATRFQRTKKPLQALAAQGGKMWAQALKEKEDPENPKALLRGKVQK